MSSAHALTNPKLVAELLCHQGIIWCNLPLLTFLEWPPFSINFAHNVMVHHRYMSFHKPGFLAEASCSGSRRRPAAVAAAAAVAGSKGCPNPWVSGARPAVAATATALDPTDPTFPVHRTCYRPWHRHLAEACCRQSCLLGCPWVPYRQVHRVGSSCPGSCGYQGRREGRVHPALGVHRAWVLLS